MAIKSKHSICITNFRSTSSGEDSPWTLRIHIVDEVIKFDLHWADKEAPTNTASEDFNKFFALLQLSQI